MPDRAGQQLGNYRLLHLLGRGGFAEVYLGEHVYLKRRAALKVLHISLDDEDVEHFLAEAQVLARLDHPNIVRVHEFAVEQGTPFLVMDYASRGTLRQRYPRGSCLSLETTVASVKQIAAALQYAHNHRVIHRDVKPENMLLGAQQEVMLSDFGISLLSPSPEQLSTQEMAGTLPYMAPEQIRGKPGFGSDQYSLAVVVYEWLCGVRPFEGSTWQIAYQQVSLAPAPLREHDPSLSESVEEVVLKALAKDPRDRYVSVQLFAQALERASQVSRRGLDTNTEGTVPLDAIFPAAARTPPALSQRIFLSATPEDEAFAASITSDLQQRGIAVCNEDPEFTQNVLVQENGVRQAIRAVDVVLLVVSPATPSSRSVRQHLRIASLYQRQLVFVWSAGEDIAAVLPDEWGQTAQVDLVDARHGRYKQALDEIVACLEARPVEELALPEPAEELREPRNPYKGLRPFTQNDAADFFERDSLIAELVERLREAGPSGMAQSRLLAVIGPSGSGKSSVVMAGLLPRLQGGALAGSERWVYLEPMVPGTHPLEALSIALASRFPERSFKAIREDLQDESARGLHLLAAQFVKASGQKVVLLIDQFEELFTQTTDEEERQHFIDLLVTAMTEPQGAVIVILTLRADLYDRPISYPALGRLIVQRQVLVWPMDMHDLWDVIKRPAALPDVHLSFEGNLVGDLLFEVQGQVGALPLLQFTLEQLFERRDGHTLSLQAYQEMGGVKGALARHAEATYAALPSEEHRRLTRALFLRLLDPGLTEHDMTRRRADFIELSLPDARQTDLLKETADAFIKARLLTTNEVAGVTTIEVSHEALLREWARLAAWLPEARDDIRLQQAISGDAVEWEQHGKSRDRLYRGSQLKEARAWVRRNIPSRSEVAFLHASATRRTRVVVSLFTIVLLVLSTTGLALRFFLLLPPDPTIVTSLSDDGPGSLRQAIDAAKPGSTITFDAKLRGKTILTHDTLDITKNLTIRGPGAGNLAINSNTSVVVEVFKDTSLTVMGLTFRGGQATGIGNGLFRDDTFLNDGTLILIQSAISGSASKGIGNSGTLTLRDSVISHNKDIGIENMGRLTITRSTISGNAGGGINNNGFPTVANSGIVTITNSTISDNTASNSGSSSGGGGPDTYASGGGIDNSGTLTITNSTISDNTAASTYEYMPGPGPVSTTDALVISGGGIFNHTAQGTVTITNSTISGNTAASNYSTREGNGTFSRMLVTTSGGITNYGSTVTITNSTISGNTASIGKGFDRATFSVSGGITNYGGKADITFCTLYENTAQGGGRDIFTGNGEDDNGQTILGHVQIRNSIGAGDSAHPGPDIAGMLSSYGYNLFQDNSGATFDPATSKLHGTDKTLSVNDLSRLFADPVELRNNGGPTRTFALGPNSPAVDQILLAACDINGITTDQRGMRRPDGKEQFCDIGAYESSY